MRRRLAGHISGQAENVGDFIRLLHSDETALRKLKNLLTIKVTEFFRDRAQFELLRTKILPELLTRSNRLNIWSAGCSHGGEPYSTAILLDELSPGVQHRILATDIDEPILSRAARGGPYHAPDVANVDGRHVLKYFRKEHDGYYVIDELRKKVTFRQHDLLRDRFESGFDLIICRNVVIYFSDNAKKGLYGKFNSSLKEGGLLFIGATEALMDAAAMGFVRVDNCFYRKLASSPARAAPGEVKLL
jgi:chemotaxis protein methyltransferase CheR